MYGWHDYEYLSLFATDCYLCSMPLAMHTLHMHLYEYWVITDVCVSLFHVLIISHILLHVML